MKELRGSSVYGYTRSAGRGGAPKRYSGPVRRGFAALAVICTVLAAMLIIAVSLLAQALAGGGSS